MVAGPYASGGADAVLRAARLAAMNRAALAVFRLGHVPVIGVNMALPVIAAAEGDTPAGRGRTLEGRGLHGRSVSERPRLQTRRGAEKTPGA